MCGQVHCLYSLLPPATNYSLKHRPNCHPIELPRYNYDPSRKSFVIRCHICFFHCVFFVLILLLFFVFFLRVRLLRALNKDRVCLSTLFVSTFLVAL